MKTPIEEDDSKEDVKKKTIKLKEVWQTISADDDFKRMPYRERRQYNRDEFYKWCEEQLSDEFNEGNRKTGKLLEGVSLKDSLTDYISDSDEAITKTEFCIKLRRQLIAKKALKIDPSNIS